MKCLLTLKSLGLKGPGLKLGVEKSGVEMSFNQNITFLGGTLTVAYSDNHVYFVSLKILWLLYPTFYIVGSCQSTPANVGT